MEIDIVTSRDLAVLRCRGRLILGDGAAALRVAARRALLRQAVALDLGRVTQIDAHGTGVLAELADIARRGGHALVLAGTSGRVRRLLRLTRLDTVIPAMNDSLALAHDAVSPSHAAGTVRV